MFWTRPRFKHHFRVAVAEEERVVFLLAEKEHFVLKGDTYVALAPLLTGKNSLDNIVSALDNRVAVGTIWHALTEMENKGYITEECDSVGAGQAAFWSALGINPALAGERLAATSVAVRALGELSQEPMIAQFLSAGINVANEGGVLAVLTDDYLRDELAVINREAKEKGIPWMLVKPTGATAFVGPLFIPGKTACWECLADRLKGSYQVERAVGQMAGRNIGQSAHGTLPSGEQAVLSMAILELTKWIAGAGNRGIEGNLITVDLHNLDMQPHAVQRLPQCLSCGQAVSAEARPVELVSCSKNFTADGGHRVARPEETYRKYSHLVDNLTGLVSEVKRMGPENSRVHLYLAGENRALSSGRYSLKRLKANLRINSAGKGMTDAQAKASALCEALERVSGVFRGDEPRIKASYRELGQAAIHPDACLNFSRRQYREREEINRQEFLLYYVPETFDETAVIDWTPVWSLTSKRFRYLPAEYCYYGYPGSRFAWGDSNGNAAGNTLEEAVLQGFFELVERDAVALWWYNRLQRPAVDLHSFDELYYRELETEYRQMGRKLWAIDLTTDLGIPAFAALSCDAGGIGSKVIFGFGAHFDPKIALSRAVTELNQTLSLVKAVNSGEAHLEDPVTVTWIREATLGNQPYLAPDKRVPVKTLSDYRHIYHDDLLADIEYCRRIVEDLGLEMLVLDQTRADIELPVAKVIVPGLRHFWARFGPGRLYDVPVKLGWLDKPNNEDELNPIPMFI